MRKFTFNLEAVRSLREQAENQRREELAFELLRKAQREADLEDAHSTLDRARDAGATVVTRAVTGAELLAHQWFLERAEREARTAGAQAAAQAHEVEARRQALALAARDRELLERLREKRRTEHELEVARHEDGALGEIALAVHRRSAGEGLL